LREIGLDDATIDQVGQIIRGYQTGEELDTIEYRVVHDSDALTRLAAENPDAELDQLQSTIDENLKTKAAKDRARRLFEG